MRTWFGIAILVTLLAGAAAPAAASGSAAVTANWSSAPVVKFALIPNYASGYGTVKAVFGSQPSPTPGSGACLLGCAVDFGTVLSGTDYLYKFAAHLNIITNDANGVNVYGEGAADFYNQTDGTSVALNQAVYYLASTSGGTDANTGFSASYPFYRTGGSVTGNSYSTPPTIAYTTYPAPIASTASSSTADLYYDYQLKVPATATTGAYYVWIVYTVVPK